ncbi:MAG: aminoacyl-tRNA deacylase [Candidatus Aminicenantia bacterium]
MAVPKKIINPAPYPKLNIKLSRPLKKVIRYIEKVNSGLKERDKVKYEIIEHKTVYTAFDKAQTLKIKPNIVGKTLILKTDKDLIVSLIPGNKNLDKNKLKKIINSWRKKNNQKPVKKIEFISERLMKNKFKGVKVGAVPPFGSLFGFLTFIEKSLLNAPKIVVSGGGYNWSIKISPASLKKLIPNLIKGSFTKAKK